MIDSVGDSLSAGLSALHTSRLCPFDDEADAEHGVSAVKDAVGGTAVTLYTGHATVQRSVNILIHTVDPLPVSVTTDITQANHEILKGE